MLDRNLIKFVEPIGPGQIVDRESLVALPVGQIQITIETTQDLVIVRILAMRGADEAPVIDDQSSSWNVNAYIWQNGQVIAAEKHVDPGVNNRATLPRLAAIRKKRTPAKKNFKFVKAVSHHEEDESVIDAILQVCVYKSPNGTMHRKSCLGTIHIALNCLTSPEFESPADGVACKEEWFKIFPKSTFLPGCPSGIAKTNCAISSRKQSDKTKPQAVTSGCRELTRSQSTVSYKQYDLKIRPQTESDASELTETSVQVEATSSPNNAKSRITTWVKRKLLRQATDLDLSSAHRRTPDIAKREDVCDDAPVIVGPRRRAYTSPPLMYGAVPKTRKPATGLTSPVKQSETARLPLAVKFQSAKGKVGRAHFKASASNNSSFDVGYESGRSRCISSSDEENCHKSAESNLDALCEKGNEAEASCQTQTKCNHEVAAAQPAKVTTRRPVIQKQRPPVLRSTSLISNTVGFTSLKDIGRQNSKASLDSAICECPVPSL